MKKLIVCMALFLIVGCHTPKTDPDTDPRPPLMNNNSFTNFVPQVFTNYIDSMSNNTTTAICQINKEKYYGMVQ